MDARDKKFLVIVAGFIGAIIIFGVLKKRRMLKYSSKDEVMEFLRTHPNPTDEEWEMLIKKYNMDPDDLGSIYVDIYGESPVIEEWAADDKKKKVRKLRVRKDKIGKEDFKKMFEKIKGFPSPKSWDKYYDTEIWPKMKKIIKGLIIAGGVLSPVIAGAIAVNVIAEKKKFKGLASLDDKGIEIVRKLTEEIMGRVITLAGIFLANDRDIGKMLKTDYFSAPTGEGDVLFNAVDAPTIDVDWDKVDEKKLFQAAMFFADDSANAATAGGTVAASPTGVGAVVGAIVTGGVAGVTLGTDIYAFKLVADAIAPAIDIKKVKKDMGDKK